MTTITLSLHAEFFQLSNSKWIIVLHTDDDLGGRRPPYLADRVFDSQEEAETVVLDAVGEAKRMVGQIGNGLFDARVNVERRIVPLD